MQDLSIRVLKVREAAAVERCHTVPHHGSYSNGAHQYGCAMLYLQLCPDPNIWTLRAILVHDLGERWVGDNPAPAKWSMATELRSELEELEQRCLKSIGELWNLPPADAKWLKAVDCLDLWLWSQEQVAMGNLNAAYIIDNINDYVSAKPYIFPEQVVAFMADYSWTRTNDEIPS